MLVKSINSRDSCGNNPSSYIFLTKIALFFIVTDKKDIESPNKPIRSNGIYLIEVEKIWDSLDFSFCYYDYIFH